MTCVQQLDGTLWVNVVDVTHSNAAADAVFVIFLTDTIDIFAKITYYIV